MSEGPTHTLETPRTGGRFHLAILGPGTLRVLTLPEGEPLSVGRESSCFVQLGHDSVSRQHAEVRAEGDGTTIEDLGSKNGTFLDGERLPPKQRVPLRVGSVVEVGEFSVVLQRGPAPRGTPSVTESPPPGDRMARVLALVDRVASAQVTVLLLGETGVGKEVIARRLHGRSPRGSGPFVPVHCAALSETLVESELFGHERGAFTGASQATPGLLESAEGGTVFIDEVGELSPSMQVKLLRVLEDRKVRRVGGRAERDVDVRFVAATHRDLEREVAEGRFRDDLYFRLSGFTIRVPPLRDRDGAVPGLATELIEAHCRAEARPAPSLSPDALAFLESYAWPGNVRELKQVLEHALVVCDGSTIERDHLPVDQMERRRTLLGEARSEPPRPSGPHPSEDPPSAPSPGPSARGSDERARILDALRQTGGNQTAAAKLLGIGRRTLIDRLDRLDIPRPRKGK